MTLTKEMLESAWTEIREYEKSHFGSKFGPDYSTLADLLRQNREFMALGAVMSLMCSMEMNSFSHQLKDLPEQVRLEVIDKHMKEPSTVHHALAEIFYLGYMLGKQAAEVAVLEKM